MSTNTASVNNFQSQATQTSFPIREIRVSDFSEKTSTNTFTCTKKNKITFTIIGCGLSVGIITAVVMGILFGPLAGLLGFLCGVIVGATLNHAFNEIPNRENDKLNREELSNSSDFYKKIDDRLRNTSLRLKKIAVTRLGNDASIPETENT